MFTDGTHKLDAIAVEGTSFQIGHALGRHGAATVHRHLLGSHAWAVVTGFRGSPRVRAALALAQAHFPDHVEEIRGIAEGLDLPFDDVFAWNCRGDLGAMSPDGCTTLQFPGTVPVIAHNEDGDPGLRPGCRLATVRPARGRAFTAFVYPGSLPGHTFAVNDAGLVVTVNNIRSRADGDGLPRMLLVRALLDCGSTAEAISLLEALPRAGAFHLTLGRTGEATILSVEFSHDRVSILPVTRPSSHANHLVHAAMRDERQVITASSRSRQDQGDALITAASGDEADALAILRNRERKALPIFRTQPDDPDNENTLATACFRIGADRIRCAVYDGTDTAPRFSFANDALDPD